MAELLLGVDVGTYSTKGVVTDPGGSVIAQAAVGHDVEFPRPGWAEQDADRVWWDGVVAVIGQLLESPRVDNEAIAAVGVSAIGPCMLPLDSAQKPLRPGILYGVDTRAESQIESLKDAIGRQELEQWSGMHLSSQAVGPKIMWYREEEPELWARTAHIVTASSYLTLRLTGELVIDQHQSAHFIPLYDRREWEWSDRYSDGICDLDLLPRIAWSDQIAGVVSAAAASETGLRVGTPVVVGGVDAMSEALSAGVVKPGDLMIMYGSTAFFVLSADHPVGQPPAWTLPGLFEGSHVAAAGMATAGSLTRWLVDLTSSRSSTAEKYAELFAEVAEVPPGSGGLLMLPYFSGERTPINDPGARGVVIGLSLATSRGQLFRAALESVACGVRHNLAALDPTGELIDRCVAIGGGANTDVWLQIVSDVIQRTQLVPRNTLGASFGNAFLSGMGAGLLTLADIDSWVRYHKEITPDVDSAPIYDDLYATYLDLYKATRPLMDRLN